ncbi:hypothetical protein [Chryseobacterium sp. MMS23-Vi53]|uniref:hypothetical protein n=1 Tax=Chryseobacterium sp. MMS23-Vi53 TaxID=3386644 RepID=UPI0039ECF559
MEKKEDYLIIEKGIQDKLLSFHQNIHPINILDNVDNRKYLVYLISSEIKEIRRISQLKNESFEKKLFRSF